MNTYCKECARPARSSSGHCDSHYRKLKHLGTLGNAFPCPTEGCRYFVAKGPYCLNCYEAKKRQTPEAKDYERNYRKRYIERNYESHRAYQNVYQEMWWRERGGRERKREYYTSPEGRRKYAARTAKRRSQKLNATPPWVDTAALTRVYEQCPEGMEVDHIVPLQGKDVCGLHVPWNLQYLTPEENRRKGNRYGHK